MWWKATERGGGGGGVQEGQKFYGYKHPLKQAWIRGGGGGSGAPPPPPQSRKSISKRS